MKIKFLQPVQTDVCVGFENDYPIFENETFSIGEIHDVDILDELDGVINVQFGDSSVADFRVGVQVEILGEWVERSSGWYLVDESEIGFGPTDVIFNLK